MKTNNPNYSTAMESAMIATSPISYDSAVSLAETFGKSTRSVIAKAVSMDGVTYVARPKVAKNGSDIVRKAEIVMNIADFTNVTSVNDLSGLEKATKTSLLALLDGLTERANATS